MQQIVGRSAACDYLLSKHHNRKYTSLFASEEAKQSETQKCDCGLADDRIVSITTCPNHVPIPCLPASVFLSILLQLKAHAQERFRNYIIDALDYW